MNDTSVRFLNAVLERVAEDRIVEVRLFPAIRQGGIESGVAVLAVEPEPETTPEVGAIMVSAEFHSEAEMLADDDLNPEVDASGGLDVEIARESLAADGADESPPRVEVDRAPVTHHDVAAHPEVVVAAVLDVLDRESALVISVEGKGMSEDASATRMTEVVVEVETRVLAGDASDPWPDDSILLGDILALPAPDGAAIPTAGDPARRRLAILCARYKLIVKGPDRGRWELEVMHQADAPLDTLERVIAGVVRRSGEGSEPERFTRHSLRETLNAPAWARSA